MFLRARAAHGHAERPRAAAVKKRLHLVETELALLGVLLAVVAVRFDETTGGDTCEKARRRPACVAFKRSNPSYSSRPSSRQQNSSNVDLPAPGSPVSSRNGKDFCSCRICCTKSEPRKNARTVMPCQWNALKKSCSQPGLNSPVVSILKLESVVLMPAFPISKYYTR